jgi:hypothetical protein
MALRFGDETDGKSIGRAEGLCVVLAMLLTAGVDLSVLRWANAVIDSSIIGGTLVHAWRGLFV